MRITVEISVYPLVEDYTSIIIEFIKRLKTQSELNVHSTAMSTYVSGEFDNVMQTLTIELKKLYEKVPDSSTVIKIIPKDLNIEKGFLNF
jgi:uncharacterized protein YqgV (UPF0045/DUF77 family)